MTAAIYPDSQAVGQVETFRVLSDAPGETFVLTVDNPAGEVTPVAGAGGTRFMFASNVEGDYVVTATGDLGSVATLALHIAAIPSDLVGAEKAIRGAIRNIIAGIPYMGNAYDVERWPETDNEEEAVTTVPDPVSEALRHTNCFEIGVPDVGVTEFTGDKCVSIRLAYPLSYTLGVQDSWASPDFPFANSSDMFIAMYFNALRALAQKRTLGFANVFCELLQQPNAGTLANERGEALSHVADWLLVVTVKRPL